MFAPHFPVEISRDAFCNSWTVDDDRAFWRRLGGTNGLLQVWRDGRRLTQRCLQRKIHPSDRAFLVRRKRLATLCTALSVAGNLPRVFAPHAPHFFARFAVQTFCEMLDRSELIAEEHADFFDDDKWFPIRYVDYSSPFRTEA